jgi:hypothetical protein
MELQVKLEPLAVQGEPLVIEGWICGTLMPAAPDELFPVTYAFVPKGPEWTVVRRLISTTEDFLLDYINVANDVAAAATAREKRLCSAIKKYGVIGYTVTMPNGLPPRCAEWWRRAENSNCVPFAVEVEPTLLTVKRVAARWDLLRAMRSGDPDEIAAAQYRRGLIEPPVEQDRKSVV